MDKVMLLYPPGKAYQRSEDRAQCNIDESAVVTMHACNDLGYGAAVLRQRQYQVRLRDYQTEKTNAQAIREEILEFQPDLVVISTTNGAVLSDLEFVRWIRSFHACHFVLKGAIFFDPAPECLETLDLSGVDYLVGGELDTVIGELVDAIARGGQGLDTVPGILYRASGVFHKTRFDQWQIDLDAIPFPARDLMNNGLYVRPDTGEPMATIQVARGCPAGCTYCLTPVISGRAVRMRSIENIYQEVEDCYLHYGIRNFFFKADTFTMDEAWATALCDRILASPLRGKIAFTVNSRANPRYGALYQKLKDAGCFMVAVGFESGKDDTLQRIRKGTTRQDNLETARLIHAVGLPLFGFFMIGFPWETEQDVKDTLSFMSAIDPDFVEVHIAMPYYGTKLYTQCQEYGTIRSTAWGSDYFSPNTSGTATVPLRRIQVLRNRYLLRFYLRPKYLLKKIGSCLTQPKVLKNYVKHGLILLKTIFLNPILRRLS